MRSSFFGRVIWFGVVVVALVSIALNVVQERTLSKTQSELQWQRIMIADLEDAVIIAEAQEVLTRARYALAIMEIAKVQQQVRSASNTCGF